MFEMQHMDRDVINSKLKFQEMLFLHFLRRKAKKPQEKNIICSIYAILKVFSKLLVKIFRSYM